MGADGTEARADRPRLATRDRRILAGVTVLALAAAVSAFFCAVLVSFHLFGEQPTARDTDIYTQAGRAFLWALASPFCAWAALRGGRKAVAGGAVWGVLAVACGWWQWPAPASSQADDLNPLWLNAFGVVPWALVVAGLVLALAVARRHGAPRVWRTTSLAVATVALLAAGSAVNLVRNDVAERPVPLPGAAEELEVLEDDPLWSALPSAYPVERHEHVGERAEWGQVFPTLVAVTLGDSEDHDLFEAAAVAAERTGWQVHDSDCSSGVLEGTFTKDLPTGPAYLDMTVAPWTQGVRLEATMGLPPGPAEPSRCWA